MRCLLGMVRVISLDLGAGAERGLAHRVEGLLDGEAVVAGEGLEQGPADLGVCARPSRPAAPPTRRVQSGLDLGGEDAVGVSGRVV